MGPFLKGFPSPDSLELLELLLLLLEPSLFLLPFCWPLPLPLPGAKPPCGDGPANPVLLGRLVGAPGFASDFGLTSEASDALSSIFGAFGFARAESGTSSSSAIWAPPKASEVAPQATS